MDKPQQGPSQPKGSANDGGSGGRDNKKGGNGSGGGDNKKGGNGSGGGDNKKPSGLNPPHNTPVKEEKKDGKELERKEGHLDLTKLRIDEERGRKKK